MKRHLEKIIGSVLALTMVISLTGCTTYNNFKAAFFPGDEVAQEQTIKIGIYESISGQNSQQGKEEVMGIELAHEMYPTVLGKNVELIYGDNHSNMYTAETVIQELLSQGPSIILGSYGETVTLVASDYIKAASTPAITISSTNPLITANNEYYFSATFTETRQGDALAEFAYTAYSKDTVATVKLANDDSATATIKRFTNKMKKLSDNNKCVVGSYTLQNDTTNFSETLEAIRSSGAKAVFLDVSPSTAREFLQQAVDSQLTHILWLGDRSWNDEDFLKFVKGQPKLKVAYASDFSQEATTAMSEEFLTAYQEKYGAEAVPSETTAVAFDAYLLAIHGIDSAQDMVMETTVEDLEEKYETDAALRAATEELLTAQETGVPSGRHIKMALQTIEDFEGASGIISYNGKNEATKTITINYIDGGMEKAPYTVG